MATYAPAPMAAGLLTALEHVRAANPLHFPSEAMVPESKRHLRLRTLLYMMLERELAGRAAVGCDQFVYWNAADPRRCLAPDAFVRLGGGDDAFDSWKTWERGAPELAVEIVSPSDAATAEWTEKLARYRELGVLELVRFDPDAKPGVRLRVWDRLEGDLVERIVRPEGVTPALAVGLTWVVAPAEGEAAALRLARDAAGKDLIATVSEALEREAEGRQREAEGRQREAEGRQREAEAREAAERRVAELEAELRRRRT